MEAEHVAMTREGPRPRVGVTVPFVPKGWLRLLLSPGFWCCGRQVWWVR